MAHAFIPALKRQKQVGGSVSWRLAWSAFEVWDSQGYQERFCLEKQKTPNPTKSVTLKCFLFSFVLFLIFMLRIILQFLSAVLKDLLQCSGSRLIQNCISVEMLFSSSSTGWIHMKRSCLFLETENQVGFYKLFYSQTHFLLCIYSLGVLS